MKQPGSGPGTPGLSCDDLDHCHGHDGLDHGHDDYGDNDDDDLEHEVEGGG